MINDNDSLYTELLVAEEKEHERSCQKNISRVENGSTKTSKDFSQQDKQLRLASNDTLKEKTFTSDERNVAEEKKSAKLSLLISNKDNLTEEKDCLEKSGFLKPSQILLDNWKLWMALEVVRQLKDDNFENENVNDYFEMPTAVLQKRFEAIHRLLFNETVKLRKTIDATQKLPKAKALLEKYYFETITFEVQKIAEDPTMTDISAMKKNLYLKIENIKPKSLINLMQATVNKLLTQKNHALAEEKKYIEMEYSAFQAYLKMSQEESPEKIESAWNAIEMSIKSKLRALEQNTIAQLYTAVIVHCNLYCQWAKKSLIMLEQIECSLKEKSSLKPICLPDISAIDIDEQQKSLESWIGHCTNHWGMAPVNWLSIEKKLLENLEVTAQSIFQDFLDQFMEYVIIEDNKPTFFNNF